MSKKIFLVGLLISICAVLGLAQDEKKAVFEDAKLPKTAGSAEKFAAPGWVIEEMISGDLNNDNVADVAVVFIEKPKANADKDAQDSRERVLMVLFKNQKGDFERIATAQELLPCTQCGGMLGGNSSAADIKIIKGVLIVNSLSGSRESTETTFRFRYNPKAARLALIGFDMVESDRGTGSSTRTSTNYLTRLQITEEYQYNNKLDKDVKKSTKQTRVTKPTKYIEDVDYGAMMGGN